MTNFDAANLDWTTGLLAGWTYDKPVNKWFQGQFRNAHRLTRACPTCSDVIVLDVTTKALQGKATNHGLALRRCKKCRTALKAGPEAYAARKAAVTAEPTAAVVEKIVDNPLLIAELETLRTANAIMKDELTGLYAQLKELHELYELRPALEAVAHATRTEPEQPRTPGGPLVMGTPDSAGAELLQKFLDKNSKKMPWEG